MGQKFAYWMSNTWVSSISVVSWTPWQTVRSKETSGVQWTWPRHTRKLGLLCKIYIQHHTSGRLSFILNAERRHWKDVRRKLETMLTCRRMSGCSEGHLIWRWKSFLERSWRLEGHYNHVEREMSHIVFLLLQAISVQHALYLPPWQEGRSVGSTKWKIVPTFISAPFLNVTQYLV